MECLNFHTLFLHIESIIHCLRLFFPFSTPGSTNLRPFSFYILLPDHRCRPALIRPQPGHLCILTSITNSSVSASNLEGLEKVLRSKLVVIDETSMSGVFLCWQSLNSGRPDRERLLNCSAMGELSRQCIRPVHDILSFFLVRELKPSMLLTVPLRCNFEVCLVHLPLLISPSCYWELSQARGPPLAPKITWFRGSPTPYIYSHRHPPIYAPVERFSTCHRSFWYMFHPQLCKCLLFLA
jgi:hypothetical protein